MNSPADSPPASAGSVKRLVERARSAQSVVARYDQAGLDDLACAAAWAILEPGRNRQLAERAVADTGMGSVSDKIAKNERKTLGLLRDLHGAVSTGVLREDAATGITELARPVGVVAALTPSTNPAATPANKIINALKGGNAIILAPSPKGWRTARLLADFVNAELARVGAPEGLVQVLPGADKAATAELMQRVDLVVATGSQANVRAAYGSGTPAFGVGAGNVAVIVDESADIDDAARKVARSKTFDHATSCSSENSLVAVGAVAWPLLDALARAGGVRLRPEETAQLESLMFEHGRPKATFVGQSAARIAELARLSGVAGRSFADARFLIVEPFGVGPAHPFSGEKLSPVLAFYRVGDFAAALAQVDAIYRFQGAGHSVGLHSKQPGAQALQLAKKLPVCRVIVNQAHAIATGGAFDNGLPFSLSMGCGSWGRNGFSENLNYRHFLNVTRIVRPIPPREVSLDAVLGDWWLRHGK